MYTTSRFMLLLDSNICPILASLFFFLSIIIIFFYDVNKIRTCNICSLVTPHAHGLEKLELLLIFYTRRANTLFVMLIIHNHLYVVTTMYMY